MEVETTGNILHPTAWARVTATTWECKMTSSTENSVPTENTGDLLNLNERLCIAKPHPHPWKRCGCPICFLETVIPSDDLSASIYGLPLQIIIQLHAFHTLKAASGCFGEPRSLRLHSWFHRTNRTFGHTTFNALIR